MPYHAMLRVGSILAIVVFAALSPRSGGGFIFLICLAISHYLLALIYSRKQISRMLGHARARWAFLGLVLAAAALYQSRFSLVLYFGIHHVFNEVYLLRRVVRLDEGADARALRVSSLLLNFCLYFVLLRHHRELAFLNAGLLWAALGVGYAAFFYYLLRLRAGLKVSELIDISAFEVLGLLLVAASFYVRMDFLSVVLYHVFFWTLYPLAGLAKQGGGRVVRYGAWTFAVLALCLFLSPLGVVEFSAQQWFEQFRFGTFLHITLSFALSSAHPVWITRWLQPQHSPSG